MILVPLSLAVFALLGHAALFIYVVNRLHALALPRPLIKLLDVTWSAFAALLPLALGLWLLQSAISHTPALPRGSWGQALLIYFAICIFAAISAVFHRVHYLLNLQKTELLTSNHTRVIDLVERLGHRPAGQPLTRLLSYLPGNEIYELSIHEKTLTLATMQPQLEGLAITHLSDLHMTGQLTQSFYDEIVSQANQLESDIIVITGDIIERRQCLGWIAPTLGRLRARHGVFYVVGNHELRMHNIGLVRRTLDQAGLIGLGNRWQRIFVDGCPVVLAGNELPWFKPAADMSDCPAEHNGMQPLKILLSHSPDQLEWARRRGFDLMLAGHTHGGQVRLPLVGPILAPSRDGIKHASGTFYAEPTLMHVSRGLAGTRPLRLNCRPELAKLVLKKRQAL